MSKVLLCIGIIIGCLVLANAGWSQTSEPPWGTTPEGRIGHLESELADTQADVNYAFARIRILDAKVASLQHARRR
jgi:hypothetical protein